jgi:hypothetical protein
VEHQVMQKKYLEHSVTSPSANAKVTADPDATRMIGSESDTYERNLSSLSSSQVQDPGPIAPNDASAAMHGDVVFSDDSKDNLAPRVQCRPKLGTVIHVQPGTNTSTLESPAGTGLGVPMVHDHLDQPDSETASGIVPVVVKTSCARYLPDSDSQCLQVPGPARASSVTVSEAASANRWSQSLPVRIQIELSCFIMTVYGLVTVLLSAPALYVWSAASLEPFSLPSREKLDLIMLNTALYTLYNGLLVFGILVTTPLFMSVGTMLVMPCSIVVDKLVYNSELSASALAGAVAIVLGFAMLNVPQSVASRWYVVCKQKMKT